MSATDHESGGRRGVYVASKTRHAEMWKMLRERGLPVVSSWIDEAGACRSTSESWERFVAECRGAAALILYAEEGDRLEGALVEVGAALSAGVPVLAVGPVAMGRFPFVRHPLVTTCSSLDEAVLLAGRLAEDAEDRVRVERAARVELRARSWSSASPSRALELMYESLVIVDLAYLRAHPEVPEVGPLGSPYAGLRAAGVIVGRRSTRCGCVIHSSDDQLLDVGEMLSGPRPALADVDDVAAWRVAELRASGEDPLARVELREERHPGYGAVGFAPSGPRHFSVVVSRGDGSVERFS